ncbi:MAG: long-chain fatty acid--CoA ligase [Betaproteobacteria bacterium]|nr:long-chain fatty acid--CoA ligase [Betaproteobacteria bacterium]
MNIAQLLVRAARVFPHRVAIARGFASHATYGELARRAAAIAHTFTSALRLQPGDRVVLYLPNCPEYLEVLAGIWWAGLTAVPVNAALQGQQLTTLLEDSQAALCFTAAGGVQASVAAIGEARTIDIASSRYQQIARSVGEASIAWNVPDDLAWLFYTGGTTAQPKGVMLSHRNLLAMTLCYFADVDAIGAETCMIHTAPMSHGSGLYALPHFTAASTQVIPESGAFDPAEVRALATHWRNATMLADPTMIRQFVAALRVTQPDIAQLKTIVCGGPLNHPDAQEARSVLGPRLVQIYGPAECPMTVTALSRFNLNDTKHPRYHARIASVGVPQSAVEVRIVDHEDRLSPPGQAGEIVVRGEPAMRGYWMNARATAKALKGGWLHTGDTGVFDADGFLTLVGPEETTGSGQDTYPR